MKETFASQLRPKTLGDVVGQEHLMPLLKKITDKREKISLLLYGVPGIGKTSMAYALCNDLKVSYSYFNAATGNKKILTELIQMNDYLIIDEIHRLNKDKQDILLPSIEFGKINIIATTTENPFFVVNPAIRSRLHILQLKTLTTKEIIAALKKVINKHKLKVKINSKMLEEIANNSNGDYRYSLNIINLINKLYPNENVTKAMLKNIMPSIHFYSDRKGDGHYDLLSAFHKSLRGSDTNAALFYLAKLIQSGDIIGMERRMLAATYEDVGMANPNLGLRINNAIEVAKKIGFPEARLPLANAVIDITKANKSNSTYLAIEKAIRLVEGRKSLKIPKHLKDAHYKSAAKLGNGIGYKYPHDYGGFVLQQYLPDEIKDEIIYKKNKNDKI